MSIWGPEEFLREADSHSVGDSEAVNHEVVWHDVPEDYCKQEIRQSEHSFYKPLLG